MSDIEPKASPASFGLRLAGADDSTNVADLYLLARRSAAGSIPPLVHDEISVRNWISGVIASQAEVWLAEDASGVVRGLLVLDGRELDQLYVDPEQTDNGLGSRLVDHAKAVSPDGLALWTFASNEGAQRFYRRHGFVETGGTDGDNEEGEPDIRLEWTPSQ